MRFWMCFWKKFLLGFSLRGGRLDLRGMEWDEMGGQQTVYELILGFGGGIGLLFLHAIDVSIGIMIV